jgi:hypothetical protein
MDFYDNLSKNTRSKKTRMTVTLQKSMIGSKDEFGNQINRLGLKTGQSRNRSTSCKGSVNENLN